MGSIKSSHVGNEYDAYRDTTDYNQQDDINHLPTTHIHLIRRIDLSRREKGIYFVDKDHPASI
jgi:hypothetical protein